MENPFEYQDVDGPRVPLFRRPVPLVQHLLSLGLLLFGVFSGFVSLGVLVHGMAWARGGSAGRAAVGFVAAAIGYGLHRDRAWSTWGAFLFFCAVLVGLVIYQGFSESLLIYVWPVVCVPVTAWLIQNHRERHGF
jgi:hypothetical protein